MRLLLFCFLCCLNVQTIFAQYQIEEKLKWYALAKPTNNLFVHFDKNVYSNNETIYFTGYLIKEGVIATNKHKILSLALIRDADSALILEDKFLIASGISFGSVLLPDSLLTGNYHLLAYTDQLINGMPESIFTQNITLKTNIIPALKANLKIVGTASEDYKSNRILLSVTTKDNRFLPKPATVSYQYGNITKKINTDVSGQLLITLPEQVNLKDQNLHVKLNYERDSVFLSLPLPNYKNRPSVKFYPEGGNMVVGLATNIGWEVKDQQNMPIALKALLYKNNVIIDTIETSSYGIGKFKLRPELGVDYAVKLIHSNLIDSIYKLPKLVEKGLILNMQTALIGDTLRFSLKSNDLQDITIMMHNFRKRFLNVKLDRQNLNKVIKIPLNDVPKGLTTITILDSLNRPLAERIFFAHYDGLSKKIDIATTKEIYQQREKVTINLKLNSDEQALVSVASVQNNRLALNKMNDIESYSYLANELGNLPVHVEGKPYKDINYLEQILLIKGWRRYSWQGLTDIKPKDSLLKFNSLQVSGQVSISKNAMANPQIIGTMGNLNLSLINITSTGFFSLNKNHLLTPVDKKMYVFVSGNQKSPDPTKININDEFTTLNQKIIKEIEINRAISIPKLVNNTDLVLKKNEKAILLKEVVIKGRNSFNYSIGRNPCGDYVCEYNVLNCRNHPLGIDPIEGRAYSTNSGTTEIYESCVFPDQNIFTLVKGIHLQKEFYCDDYKEVNEPAFFSTIYWNYGVMLNSKNETELSFYTGDITGKFRIIVQGIAYKNVLYAEHFFEVKEK